jgi:hypothetical protein
MEISTLPLIAWLGIITIWWFSFVLIIQEISKWFKPKQRRCKDCKWYRKNRYIRGMWCLYDKSWTISAKECGNDYTRKRWKFGRPK